MRLRASQLADAAGGVVHGGDVTIDGATIDSRLVTSGQLFVAVKGIRDGHDFIAAALDAGAAAYVTSRSPRGGTAIEVDDTVPALLAMGARARRELGDIPVVAITGSVGKTTVKDLARTVLAGRRSVAASERSFNNELGVPLTLLDAPDGTGAAVVEMGSRGPGQVRVLCDVARPTIGVVTCVAAAHTELFGSLEGVAAAKGELVEALPSSGAAVLNADDPLVSAMAARTAAAVLRFGENAGADVRAGGVELDDRARASFRLTVPDGSVGVHLAIPGRHQVANALAAAAVGVAVGVSPEEIAGALGQATTSPWRMEVHRTAAGATVVNDAYNANPASMAAALQAVAALPARRRIAVLGVMAELGPEAAAEHERMAALAGELGIDVIAVDTAAYGVHAVAGVEGALDALRERDAPGPGDAVLVKGSRIAGLERLAAALLA